MQQLLMQKQKGTASPKRSRSPIKRRTSTGRMSPEKYVRRQTVSPIKTGLVKSPSPPMHISSMNEADRQKLQQRLELVSTKDDVEM